MKLSSTAVVAPLYFSSTSEDFLSMELFLKSAISTTSFGRFYIPNVNLERKFDVDLNGPARVKLNRKTIKVDLEK